jgi:uncharacterized cupin superfamily protein
MDKHKNVIKLSEVPVESIKSPDGSPFGGKRQRIGRAIGAKKLGYSYFVVPPGKAAFPFHTHYTNEEMIFIFEGEGTLRFGKEEMAVSSGMFIAFPPGPEHLHQLINTSNTDLRYLVVSTMDYPDLSEYPDSNKIGSYATSAADGGFRALYPKDSNVDYYSGETGTEIERVNRSHR